MSRAQLIKSLIKGTDLSEDAALNKYLLSRGINPKYATKDQKVAHSKTTQFISWKRNRMMEDSLGEGLTTTHTPAAKRAHALKKSVHVNTEIRTNGHDQLHSEAVDKKDTVTLDIPLLIRVLELAREDIKTDMDLHRVVEKLINIRKKGMLTMKDYNYIAKIHEEVFGENHIAVAMGKQLDDEGSMILNQLDDIDRCSQMIRDYVGKDYEKQMPAWVQSKVTLAADYINTVGTYLMSKNEEVKDEYARKVDKYLKKKYNKEEVESIDEVSTTGYHAAAVKSRQDAAVKVMSSMGQDKQAKTKLDARNRGLKRLGDRTSAEMKKANSGPQKPRPPSKPPSEAELRGYGQGRYMGDSVEHDESLVEAQSAAVRFQKALQNAKKKREEEERRNAENAKRALTPKPVQEDKFQDPMAATQTVGNEVENPSCSCEDGRKSQMTKSARIIKSLYKKKGIKEELYDHEKEDKPTTSYGKKPKMSVTKPTDNVGENKPDAAAVLTGGKTLTGQTRDTIEIDPMMKKRPGSDPTGKNK